MEGRGVAYGEYLTAKGSDYHLRRHVIEIQLGIFEIIENGDEDTLGNDPSFGSYLRREQAQVFYVRHYPIEGGLFAHG